MKKASLISLLSVCFLVLLLTACTLFDPVDHCEHIYGTYSVIREPACDTTGLEVRECTECGYVDTRPMSMLGHEYGEVDKDAPTCTVKGYNRRTCTRCAKTVSESIPALGHDFRVYEPYKEATCVEERTEMAECERCAQESIRSVANSALGHKYYWIVEEEPGDNSTGLQTQYCELCDKKGAVSTIPANSHEHVMHHNMMIAATCVSYGSMEYWYCSSCKKNYSSESGEYRYEISDVTTQKKEHVYEEAFTVDTPATPMLHGSKSRHCSADGCAASIDHKSVHHLTYVPEKAPTCINDGVLEHYYCSVDEKYFADEDAEFELDSVKGEPMTGTHIYSEAYTMDIAPTLISAGWESKHCTAHGCTATMPGSGREIPKLNK